MDQQEMIHGGKIVSSKEYIEWNDTEKLQFPQRDKDVFSHLANFLTRLFINVSLNVTSCMFNFSPSFVLCDDSFWHKWSAGFSNELRIKICRVSEMRKAVSCLLHMV